MQQPLSGEKGKEVQIEDFVGAEKVEMSRLKTTLPATGIALVAAAVSMKNSLDDRDVTAGRRLGEPVIVASPHIKTEVRGG